MKLKILHYSDQKADLNQHSNNFDWIITTGDLDYTDMYPITFIKNDHPSFGVLGNHDVGINLSEFGIQDVHKKVVVYNGIKIGGFRGCLKYKESDYMYTEDESNEFANSFPYVDILLLHAGPFGLLDDPSDSVHIGSKNMRRYVEQKMPKYVFVGHQYSNGYMKFENTEIYRTFGARIVEIEI